MLTACLLREGLAFKGQGTDMRGDTRMLIGMSSVLIRKREFEQALAFQNEALELFRKAQDTSGEGTAMNVLGDLRAAQGDVAAAEAEYARAAAKFESVNDKVGEMGSLERPRS